jgi:ribosome maturation factor RimP
VSPLFCCSDFLLSRSSRKDFTLVDLERTKALIQKIVSSEGLELVEVEFKGGLNRRILRVFIDKPQGITHEDCQRVSEQLGVELDVEDLIPGAYTLEVSSPGLTRKLSRQEDFERYRGRLVKVQTQQAVEGAKTFRGILSGFDGATVTLQLKGERTVQVPFGLISKASLDIDF